MTTTPSVLPDIALHGIALIQHLGILRARGRDAAAFLHGQLSNDFALLDGHQARLAAFCSPKGRMQASFIGLKLAPDDIVLLCSRDLLAQTIKRLSMFVLRAQCSLSDASADFTVLGLAGTDAIGQAIAGPQDSAAPASSLAPWAVQARGEARLIHLYPAGTTARALWIAPVGFPPPNGPALDTQAWLWSEVASGVATVSQPVYEAFVPQMLNYESVGGVSFKKGCYPGQEVVARSQFRGVLKRRAYIAHCDAPLTAGSNVFATSDAQQPAGTVVQAAARPDPKATSGDSGWDAIISISTSAAQERLTALRTDGPALTLLPLPYELLADI